MGQPHIITEYRDGADEQTFGALIAAVGFLDDHQLIPNVWLLRDFLLRVPVVMKPADRDRETAIAGYGLYPKHRRPLLERLLKLYGPLRVRIMNADGTPNLEASGNQVLGYSPPSGASSAHERIAAEQTLRTALAVKGLPATEIDRLLAE